MTQVIQKLFRIYPNEIKIFVWVVLIQFAMRISSILINNYAQTAFLKRYGVQYLPTIMVINSVLVFFVINFIGMLMARYRTTRVYSGILLSIALLVGICRGLIPYNVLLVYPVLFIIKSNAITTLPLLYWDILNDIFTTRQSKRLFTLIVAGGVLGTTLGSLLTKHISHWVGGPDNVLFVFIVGMIIAAVLNEKTEWVMGSPIQPRAKKKKKKKSGKFTDIVREMKELSDKSPF